MIDHDKVKGKRKKRTKLDRYGIFPYTPKTSHQVDQLFAQMLFGLGKPSIIQPTSGTIDLVDEQREPVSFELVSGNVEANPEKSYGSQSDAMAEKKERKLHSPPTKPQTASSYSRLLKQLTRVQTSVTVSMPTFTSPQKATALEKSVQPHPDYTQVPIPIGIVVVATGQRDRRGKPLPEIRWILDGRIQLWEIMKRWALDILNLTEKQLPKAAGKGRARAFAKAGVIVMGSHGPLAMKDRLNTVVKLLSIKDGHRQIAINWPSSALPAGWGVAINPKKSDGNGLCKECGGKLTFRRCANDDSIRTLAICTDCDEVRGCFVKKRDFQQL